MTIYRLSGEDDSDMGLRTDPCSLLDECCRRSCSNQRCGNRNTEVMIGILGAACFDGLMSSQLDLPISSA